MMWYREDQLVAIRIAELRAEAERARIGKAGPRSTGRVIPAVAATVRPAIERLLAATRRSVDGVGSALDAAAGSSEFPAGMFGGQGHSR